MLGKLNDTQIEHLLKNHHIGRIGCCDGRKPYVVPVNYVYENGVVYCHSGEGMKVRMMRENPSICFQVDSIQDILNWRSVIAWGKFEEISKLEEKEKALQKIIDGISPYLKAEDSHPSHGITASDSDIGTGVELVLYKLILDEMTGRFESHDKN